MKKIVILSCLFGGAFVNAATIQVNNVVNGVGDTLYADASGTLLSGSGAFGGYFIPNSGTFNFANAVSSMDFVALIANFVPLASGIIGGPSSSFGGSFAGFVEGPVTPVGAGPISAADPLVGNSLYTFVGNSATLAASTAFALVNHNRQIEDDSPFAVNYTLNPAGGVVVIGSTGTSPVNLTAAGLGTGTSPTVNLIPEPSTLLLSAFGVLGLLRRKR